MMYKIEKNIPIYEIKKKTSIIKQKNTKYPFNKMDIGDSFFVPIDSIGRSNITNAASYYNAQKNRGRYQTRAVYGGVRCWRIA
ncbi:MAG: hypothetical protein JRE47_10145 [Deltaproteobacteria bacterium]|nr:hypothetical protein [Deltaproteobacteria bacterium]